MANNDGVSLGGKGNNRGNQNPAVAQEPQVDDTVREEERGRGDRRSGRNGRGQDNNRRRRNGGDEGERVFLNRAMGRVFDQTVSKHTELLRTKFDEIVESTNKDLNDEPFRVSVMPRARYSIAYDVVIISRNYNYSAGATALAIAYLFVIGSSRGQLTDMRFDDPTLGKFTLPNVPGNTPNDNNVTMDKLRAEVERNAMELFKTSTVSFAGTRVIEPDADLHADNTEAFDQLINDAGEAITTYDNLYSPAAEDIDYNNAVIGDNGYVVATRIDYNPGPLLSATGQPIHRDLKLTVGTFTDDDIDGPVTETETAAEVSVYIDPHYGEADHEDDPCLLPAAIITNIRTNLGKNLLDVFLIALFNLTQIKDMMQYLPAYDWRKKDEFNDLSAMSFIEPALFGLEKPGPFEISNTAALFDAGRDLFMDQMEISIDISDTDAQTVLAAILADAAEPDSEGYDTVVDAMNRLTNDRFAAEFNRLQNSDDPDSDMIVIDSDNLQLGGWFKDKDQTKCDIRKVGFLAVAAHFPHDLERVDEYEDTTMGGITSPASQLRTSLDIKSEIVGQIKVTSYIRRYTFGPTFIAAGLKAMKDALLVAPIEGGQGAQRERGRTTRDLEYRGAAANSGRRGRGRRDDGRRSRR